LLCRYDLSRAADTLSFDAASEREPGLWRWAEVLPVRDPANRLSLGEGGTPLLRSRHLGADLGLADLRFKDEGVNPTGSFKARGMAVAVSMAVELGLGALSTPSAGNAAGALSAYAAAAGLPAHVFMPSDVPQAFVAECRSLGATVQLVDGLITDCGRVAAEGVKQHGRFDVSTLKEPGRLEGKKTMGYELVAQLGGRVPDVILYPTGGGTGLVGMWKAFAEMEEMGWIGSKRPRMISVQSDGCAPLVRAFALGTEFAEPWKGAHTVADGLRVPAAVGDHLVLEALRDSGGTGIAVPDEDILAWTNRLGAAEGIVPAPEAGAAVAALSALVEEGRVKPDDQVVVFVTGSGHKYAHLWQHKST